MLERQLHGDGPIQHARCQAWQGHAHEGVVADRDERPLQGCEVLAGVGHVARAQARLREVEATQLQEVSLKDGCVRAVRGRTRHISKPGLVDGVLGAEFLLDGLVVVQLNLRGELVLLQQRTQRRIRQVQGALQGAHSKVDDA